MFAKSIRFVAMRPLGKTASKWFSASIVGIALLLGTAAHAAIPTSERQVLLNIYAYTDGIDWDPQYQSGWNNAAQGTECSWYGITCDASGSTVTDINLAGVGMYGMLPSLSALTNLQSFDITQTANSGIGAYNSLFGPMPSLTGLSHLQTFKANNTYFSGSIPSLTGLVDLTDFEVFNSGFSSLGGPIPPLSGLTNLVRFDVHGNGLMGSIPPLAGLYKLAYFRVDDNHLTGSIPVLNGLTALGHFDVGGNHLTGSIPDMSGLSALSYFDVSVNQLTGNVPALVGLSNLQHFRAASNLLDGAIGEWSDLPQLSEFNVENNRLTGGLPALVQAPNLQQFIAGPSRLTGSIPDISQLNNLTVFGVAGNLLTGSPPPPPASLVSAGANSTGGADLCPNLLTPASDPPTQIDTDWDAATGTTPWSRDCPPSQKESSYVIADSSLNPSLVGQSITFTAMIEGMNPTGTVTFTTQPDAPNNANEITTLCNSVPLVDFIATCTVDSFAGGSSNTVVASYSGDVNNEPSDNGIGAIFGNVYISTIDQLVDVAVGLAVTANPAQLNQPADLTATLTGGNEADTVTFYDGQKALCANVAEHTVHGQQIAHCVTAFTTSGVHMLTASENAFGGGINVPVVENIVAPTLFDADQFALTGSWYNPPTSGQGLEIEVYPDLSGAGTGFLFGGWFTNDAAGNPQWYTLQGNLSSSHGSTYPLAIGETTGGNFNAPPITRAVADGTATLTFYDCTHAALTYQFNDGRSGTIPYVRLTPASACSSVVPVASSATLPANYSDVMHSGAWYDPATSGQGLMIDIAPSINTFFAAWYTYAPQSKGLTGAAAQRWFTLQDNAYTPGNLNLTGVPIIATSGGVFNQPSNVTVTQVGTANIAFTSCTTMTLAYSFTQGEFSGLSGTIHEKAIVPLAGCQ